jgi:hypothetical protein
MKSFSINDICYGLPAKANFAEDSQMGEGLLLPCEIDIIQNLKQYGCESSSSDSSSPKQVRRLKIFEDITE